MAYLDKAIVGLDTTNSTNQYLTFVNATTGPQDLKANVNIAYNPSSNALIIGGDLVVNGTTTTISTNDLIVKDKNIVLGNVASPSDVTADGGGITLKGTTDKTFNWVDSTDSWTSSENIALASGKVFKINGTNILSSTNAYVTANYSLSTNNSDYLDNQHGSYYLAWENFTNKPNNFSTISIDNTDIEYAWVSTDGTSLVPNNTAANLKFVSGVGANVAIDATNDAIRISHSATSSQASVNNSGATFIQDVTLDAMGHVTSLGSTTITPGTIGAQPAFIAGNVSESVSSVLTITNGSGATLNNLIIQVKQAGPSQSGYLSNTDWNSFNGAITNAYKWDGANGVINAASARTSLGANAIGSNLFTLSNPSAITYIRTKADNTVETITAATLKSDLGIANVSSSVPANTLVLHTTGATNVTFPTSGTLATTSQLPTVNDGALALTVSAAASGQGVVLGTGTGFTANEPAGTITYDIDVGPALTSLATIMNGATVGFIKKSANDTYSIDTNTYLTSTSNLDASKLTGTIPSPVLGNSNVFIGNTAVALNRGTGVLSLTGVNIDGSAGYATSAGSTTYALTAGNGLTGGDFKGNAATTFNVVSAAGTAGSVGTITVTADAVGVTLGTSNITAAAGDHGHGNILTGGTITAAAVTAANTDYILISDASNSGKIEKSIAIGTGTTTYLRNDGTWASPPDTNTDTLQSISNIATAGTYYPSFVSTTGAVVGYVAQDKLTFNPSTGTLTTTYLSGSLVSGVTTITASTYTADKAYPIILADSTTPASITIGLPAAASSNGLVFRIKKIDGSAHQVIIDANGTELIDGEETFTLIYQYQAVDLACNGTAWYIL